MYCIFILIITSCVVVKYRRETIAYLGKSLKLKKKSNKPQRIERLLIKKRKREKERKVQIKSEERNQSGFQLFIV